MQLAQVTTSFLLKKSKKRQDGKCPLYVRIAVEGRKTEVFLKKHLREGDWVMAKQRVAKGANDAELINSLVDQVANKVAQIAADLRLTGKVITAHIVKERLIGNNSNMSLLELLIKHNNDLSERVGNDYSNATLQKYKLTHEKVSEFLRVVYKVSNIDLCALKITFLEEFEVFLKTKQKLGHNTAIKHIKNLKKIIGLAIRMDLIAKNPFVSFKCTTKEVYRTCLTQQEIEKLIQKKSMNERLEIVRDIFLFSCYTGLSYADVKQLSITHIHENGQDGRIILICRTKTGVQSRIPLIPQAEGLIEKYRNFSDSNFQKKIFPVKSNQKMNEYLKEIATICEVNKSLTFHLARHTFATTVALKNGVSTEVVKTVLGHKNIRTTQIYAKMVDSRLSLEMKLLSEKIQPKIIES